MARTSRWHEAFVLASRGHTNEGIAAQMGLKVQSVKNHLSTAYGVMHARGHVVEGMNPRAYFAYLMGWRDCQQQRSEAVRVLGPDDL